MGTTIHDIKSLSGKTFMFSGLNAPLLTWQPFAFKTISTEKFAG